MDTKDEESTEIHTGKREKGQREQWDRKLDYILTMLGYLVGFGSMWRFPYVCMKNGGGAFLIPYVLTLFLLVIPVYFLETSLGQFSGKSFKDVWSYCPLIKGLGLSLQLMLVPGVCYYIMLMTWVIHYIYYTFHDPLPWSTCGNAWNTPYCFSFKDSIPLKSMTTISTLYGQNVTDKDQYMHNVNTSVANSIFREIKGHSAEEEFWQYNILDISTGLEDFGSLNGNLVLCLFLAWVAIYLCVIKGIRSTGKVVYVTATLPYLILVILLVHNLTLPGSIDGVEFFIKPDFNTLTNIKVWLEAAIQVFYSVSIGWGLHITMASYNTFNNNCLRDTFVMAIAGEATSVFGGLVIFSALGFMAHQANVPLTDVAKSGPGLGFVAYPMALAQMPLPNLWAVLFFIAMITLGLDTQFTLTEITYIYFEDCFPCMKKRQTVCRACLSIFGFVITLPFCAQAGVYLYQIFDWYIAAFAPLCISLVECISIAWLYGAERFSKDVEMMIGREVPRYIKFCWCFLSPFLLFVLMVMSIVSYTPPAYGDYEYPSWAAIAGWMISVLPIIPLLLIGLIVVYRSPGETIYQKLSHSVRPYEEWQPAVNSVDYLPLSWETHGTITERVLVNLGLRKLSGKESCL
ncbi:sodium- and chloride-dependent glycine transporter 2-like [Ylistrum balloti]|uniref:sodium- and chloride-dependent glycine transporter 2-like n=1 Tax=Ylistrum balloti TaxID=509963 RepID=UPI002905A12C|nr:sodium- and chloride-dependent glycine transporter 2-like [Ylistrum balloti]